MHKLRRLFALLIVSSMLGSFASKDAQAMEKVAKSDKETEHKGTTSAPFADVERFVDSISEKLLSKSLTFNSAIPQELYDHFQQGILKARIVIEKKDTSRLSQLDRLQQKAEELHQTSTLSPLWFLYLNLTCGELLNFKPKLQKRFSYVTMGGETMDDGIQRFGYLYEQRHELRSQLTNPDGCLISMGDKGTIKLSRNELIRLEWLIARRDCYWLPVLTENPLFPIPLMNKAYVHRIGLVGIPFENKDYDAVLDASPDQVGDHDVDHARVFDTINPHSRLEAIPYDFLDLANDPWVNFWHQLWKNLSSQEEEFLFFDMDHEAAQLWVFEGFQTTEREPDLQEIIKLVLKYHKRLDCDFSSVENYWRCQLELGGISDVITITSANHSADNYPFDNYPLEKARVICYTRNGQPNNLSFAGVNSFEEMTRETKNMITYLRQIGAPIDPAIDRQEATMGQAFYSFLKESYARFLANHQRDKQNIPSKIE